MIIRHKIAERRRVRSALILCTLCTFAVGSYILACGRLTAVSYLGTDGVIMQTGASDCGGAALEMIFRHHGLSVNYADLLHDLGGGDKGVSMLSLKQAARAQGLICEGWRLSLRDLRFIPLPAILLLRPGHYVVLASNSPAGQLLLLDPSRGRIRLSERWLGSVWGGETLLFIQPGKPPEGALRWFGGSPFSERSRS